MKIKRSVSLVLCVLGVCALAACEQRSSTPGNSSPPKFNAVDITGAEYARQFSLPDVDGKLRTLVDFKGKVTVVFFGYTQCPDVCPTTLLELAQVKQALGKDGERLLGVFITVDPERDTPEILRTYVTNFDPSFVALRGSLEQTSATAREFRVHYAKVPGQAAGSYTLDHTAASFVFDANGKLRLYSRFVPGGAAIAPLAADLKQLLAQH